MMKALKADHTSPPIVMAYTPTDGFLLFGPAQDWHYGSGSWLECQNVTFQPSCASFMQVTSSPGKFGFYPWIDWNNMYYGIIGAYSIGPLAFATSVLAAQTFQPIIISLLKTLSTITTTTAIATVGSSKTIATNTPSNSATTITTSRTTTTVSSTTSQTTTNTLTNIVTTKSTINTAQGTVTSFGSTTGTATSTSTVTNWTSKQGFCMTVVFF
eukprot:Pompholyxophrys_punicea_v1_NODE_131_length_3293_cov_4.448734.p1 type:complete len:213 gc:universal NODE_131_length_3293_cov_4.448734:1132-494(-)